VLKGGRIIQQGTPEQVYRQPVDAYTAGLFGSYNLIPATQSTAFAHLPGFTNKGKDLLIRPESFRVVASGPETIEVKVLSVVFYGNHYALTVAAGDLPFTLKTDHAAQPGDTLYLSVKPDAFWFV
jgi:ABC-type Fe3+/spermidine/putrescine transport system ATPase subunit